jgi:hypothetical protein
METVQERKYKMHRPGNGTQTRMNDQNDFVDASWVSTRIYFKEFQFRPQRWL